MGVQRGDFERVLATTEAPRAARVSTDVADVGAPLRLLAPALGSWANVFGHIAEMGTDYTARKNRSEREMYDAEAQSVAAKANLDMLDARGAEFETKRRNGTFTKDDESAYGAWVVERDAAQKNANRMDARSKLARDRWSRTGFFGWDGTPGVAGM